MIEEPQIIEKKTEMDPIQEEIVEPHEIEAKKDAIIDQAIKEAIKEVVENDMIDQVIKEEVVEKLETVAEKDKKEDIACEGNEEINKESMELVVNAVNSIKSEPSETQKIPKSCCIIQ